MWRMSSGDRVFTEAEWALFRIGLNRLRESIEEEIANEDEYESTGVPVFDHLTPEQKLALLAVTARSLRDPAAPMLEHTAANEGAIDAVLSMIEAELEFEIDAAATAETHEDFTEIRRRVLGICSEESEEREETLPEEHCPDLGEWKALLEEFADHIFWDYDFAMGDEFLDLPPEEARSKLLAFGIDPDYYLSVPQEPDKAGLTSARQTLAQLLGFPVPDSDGLYPALEDLYHHLQVGPCTDGEIACLENHPWIHVVGTIDPEWDCDFPTWMAYFKPALPEAPFELPPTKPEDLSDTPEEVRFETHGNRWVVRDKTGYYWCGLVENGWSANPDDEGLPALAFPTEAKARSAFAAAERMYAERDKRHEEAIGRLDEMTSRQHSRPDGIG